MTLRKYKKLLMSCGLDRDFAEFERKELAKHRAHMSKSGYEFFTQKYEGLASRYVSLCDGSLKKWRQKITEAIKSVLRV